MSNRESRNYKIDKGMHRHAFVCENKTLMPNEYNFEGDSITHSRFYNCVINNVNFSKAAVTGSIFEQCKFKNCNFDDADFEFCEFRNCYIRVPHINGCSFNNSNYIDTSLEKILFTSCTFTSTYFENSSLIEISIEYSTLEGACFTKSTFYDLDWRYLNLEYVEFVEPKMNNVIFPFYQIPYMFGMLQYLSNTTDSVYISNDSSTMSIDEYFEKGIPSLLCTYEKNKLYFPMGNIYLFGRDVDNNSAFEILRHEINKLAMIRDYRGIKFCCKLLSMHREINAVQRNKIYHDIISWNNSIESNSAEIKSFNKHIGEIRGMLYSHKKIPSFIMLFTTNIGIKNNLGFANLMNQFHNLAKPEHTDQVYTSFKLSQNSPLLIEVEVVGNVDFFLPILLSFLILTQSDGDKYLSYPLVKSLSEHNLENKHLKKNIMQTARKYKFENEQCGTKISLMEYYTRDCEEYINRNYKNHYINNNLLEIETESV